MQRILISGGCSFAYGDGLLNRNDSYPYIIANNYNFKILDITCRGASNDVISTSIVSEINRVLDKKVNPNRILVLAGWTESLRYDVYEKETNEILSVRPNGSQTSINSIERSVLIQAMHHPSFGYYRTLHSFNYLNTVCNHLGIKIINLHNVDIYPCDFLNNKHSLGNIVHNILIDHALTGNTKLKFKDLIKAPIFINLARKWKDLDITGHPGTLSHRNWANYIMEKYDDLLGS